MNATQQIAMLALAVGLGLGTGLHWWKSAVSWPALASGSIVGVVAAFAVFGLALSKQRVFAGLRSDLVRILSIFLPARRSSDLLVLSVLAGIGEEAIFRGFLQTWLATHLPVWVAVLTCAVAFGLVHFISLHYCVYITVLGLVFGAITVISGGPWSAVVAHAVFDFVALSLGMKYMAPRIQPPSHGS
jgi:membrane protease YdiL (CAAX protease family)